MGSSYNSPSKKSYDLSAAREKNKLNFQNLFHHSEANRFKAQQRSSYDMNAGIYRKHLSEFNKSQENLAHDNRVPEFINK